MTLIFLTVSIAIRIHTVRSYGCNDTHSYCSQISSCDISQDTVDFSSDLNCCVRSLSLSLTHTQKHKHVYHSFNRTIFPNRHVEEDNEQNRFVYSLLIYIFQAMESHHLEVTNISRYIIQKMNLWIYLNTHLVSLPTEHLELTKSIDLFQVQLQFLQRVFIPFVTVQ